MYEYPVNGYAFPNDFISAQRTTAVGQSDKKMLLWVLLLAGGSAIVAFLVLLVVALVVYWRALRRRRDDNTSISPESDSDDDSASDSVSDSELRSALPNSSGAESWKPSGTKNNENMYAPRLTIRGNSRFAGTGAVDPSHEYGMSSQEQTDGAVNELPDSYAPTQRVALSPLQSILPIPTQVYAHSIYASNSPAK